MALMTIEEARKILGKDGDKLSDEQLDHMISTMEVIARETIRAYIKGDFRKSQKVGGSKDNERR